MLNHGSDSGAPSFAPRSLQTVAALGQRRGGDPANSLDGRRPLTPAYLRPAEMDMAVYLAGSQPFELYSPKAPTGCPAAGGVPGTQVDRFGGGASRAAGPDLGSGARWVSLLSPAAETSPARELLRLKRLWERLYPGQRKNPLRSRSPESRSWEPETRAHAGGGGGWRRDRATRPRCPPHFAASSEPHSVRYPLSSG